MVHPAPILLDWLSDNGQAHVVQWAHAMKSKSSSVEARKSRVGRLFFLLRQDALELGEPPKDLMTYLIDLASRSFSDVTRTMPKPDSRFTVTGRKLN